MFLASWTANDQMALAYTVLAVGAVGTGLWTLFAYRSAQRARAVEWNHSLFKDFYLSAEMRRLRPILEYGFFDGLAPLLEQRFHNRDVALSAADIEVLGDLDTALNYLEFVLYLLAERRISSSGLEAVFDYWFGLLGDADHGALRRYVARFGFEYLARRIGAMDGDLIFVYGTLMVGETPCDAPEVMERLERLGRASVEGQLYDLGSYPGLVLDGGGTVSGDLYRIPVAEAGTILAALDRYERFDASQPERSLYVRRLVRLIEPGVDAWVYVYRRAVDEEARIRSGDWASYRAERESSSPGAAQ